MPRRTKTRAEKDLARDKRRPSLRDAKKDQIILHDLKRGEALELYLEHKSFRTIAKTLQIDLKDAHKMVNHEYEQLLASNTQKAQVVRGRLMDQYAELLERWMPLALSEDLNVGEKRENRRGEEYDVSLSAWEASAAATDKVLKITEQIAKINGLQLTKVEVKGDPMLTAQYYETIQKLVNSLKEKQTNAIEV